MKVSEKSLELNIGAEILGVIRNGWGMPKAYLRGLTQREEKQQGVDFFSQLSPDARLFAFQFKAPIGAIDAPPYRYTLLRQQHDALYALTCMSADSVFYVFPYYVTTDKLQQDVPILMQDTWLLSVDQMPTSQVFGNRRTKVVRCESGQATINPDYQISRLPSVITQNRPLVITSKPANGRSVRDIDSDAKPFRLARHEQCLERRETTTNHRAWAARLVLAAHRATDRCAS